MKQTREQREFGTYLRKGPPNDKWEQDFLNGEGAGEHDDEKQVWRRLNKIDPALSDMYHTFNKKFYAAGGWDIAERVDKDRRNARRLELYNSEYMRLSWIETLELWEVDLADIRDRFSDEYKDFHKDYTGPEEDY